MSTATADMSLSRSAMSHARSAGRGAGWHIDAITLSLVLGIVLLGLVMVTSASISIASQESGDAFIYLRRQLVLTVIGAVGAMIVVCMRTEAIERISVPLLIVAFALLFIVLVPGLDFGPSTARQYIRVSYATSMENLQEAVSRLRRFFGQG